MRGQIAIGCAKRREPGREKGKMLGLLGGDGHPIVEKRARQAGFAKLRDPEPGDPNRATPNRATPNRATRSQARSIAFSSICASACSSATRPAGEPKLRRFGMSRAERSWGRSGRAGRGGGSALPIARPHSRHAPATARLKTTLAAGSAEASTATAPSASVPGRQPAARRASHAGIAALDGAVRGRGGSKISDCRHRSRVSPRAHLTASVRPRTPGVRDATPASVG